MTFLVLVTFLMAVIADIEYVDPLGGPPDIAENPGSIECIEKVSISTADSAATAAWYEKVFGFKTESSFDTPFGTVTRLQFKNTLTVELIEYMGAEEGVYRPYPTEANQTIHLGISQYSFRVQDKSRVAEWAKRNDLDILFDFSNSPLGLYLQFIRDPTTGQLIELLQPLDNSTTMITDWSSNPMGILGWNQVSTVIAKDFNYTAGRNNAEPNFYKRFNMLLLTSEYLDLLSEFGSEVGIYGMGHLRMEMINYLASVPNTKLPPAPPHQAKYLGTYGWAWRTSDLAAAKAALLSVSGNPILYEYSSNDWGGTSIWFQDDMGLLLEIFAPYPAINCRYPDPGGDPGGNSSTSEDVVIIAVFGVAGGLFLLGICAYAFRQFIFRKDPGLAGRGATGRETGIAL